MHLCCFFFLSVSMWYFDVVCSVFNFNSCVIKSKFIPSASNLSSSENLFFTP